MKTTKLISMFVALLIVMLPVCFANELNLQYDANGNLVTGDGEFRVYNSLNQLSKIYNGSNSSGLLLEEYTYNPIEERILVKKVYNNDTTLKETVYYLDENYVRVINSSGSYDFTYVKQDGQLVAQLNPDGSKIFIHGDALGSSTIVTNQSGNVLENTTYEPYGSIVSGGEQSRFDYTGQEFDSVVGDYDYHARRYNPEQTQFTSPDPVIVNPYEPQKLNSYTYALNNPFKYNDINGKEVDLIAKDAFFEGSHAIHTYIILTPDNPSDFTGKYADYSKGFTLGGTADYKMDLVIVKDKVSDVSTTANEIRGAYEIKTPEGMTDTQFIKNIIDLYEDYAVEKKDPYGLTPDVTKGDANCNVASTSLIVGGGAPRSTFDNINPPGISSGLGQVSTSISTISASYNTDKRGQVIGGIVYSGAKAVMSMSAKFAATFGYLFSSSKSTSSTKSSKK